MHVIGAKAVALGEALRPSFRTYAAQVVENAQALAETLAAGGLPIVAGGTDTHLAVADLRPLKLTGNVAEKALERVGITLNKNTIPNDPEKPMITSGIRVGSPSGTSRGFGAAEFRAIGTMIMHMLEMVSENPEHPNEAVMRTVTSQVEGLCQRFPLPY